MLNIKHSLAAVLVLSSCTLMASNIQDMVGQKPDFDIGKDVSKPGDRPAKPISDKPEKEDKLIPDTPVNFEAEVIYDETSTGEKIFKGVKLFWDDNSDNEENFKIFRDKRQITILEKDQTEFEDIFDENISIISKNGNIIEYKVIASNQYGISKPAFLKVVLFDEFDVPKAPSGLETKVLGSKSVRFKWKDNSNNERSFVIYRNGELIGTNQPNKTLFIDKDLEANQTYDYEIKAVNNNGESDSLKVTVETKTENTQTEELIEKIYIALFQENPGEEDLKKWVEELENGRTIASLVTEFVKSDKFQDAYSDDSVFLEKLIEALLDKEPEQKMVQKFHQKILDKESLKEEIVFDVILSDDFKQRAEEIGIENEDPRDDEEKEKLGKLKQFVERFYTKALNRDAEAGGMNYWAIELSSNRQSAKKVAREFFESEEFKDKNLVDEAFVEKVYQTLMGRDADEGGLNYWLDRLGKDAQRSDVVDMFVDSNEFRNISLDFGIEVQ